MSHFTQQAENEYKQLRSKVDIRALGLKQANGEPLVYVWLQPMTAGHHVMLDRKMGSDTEGHLQLTVVKYFLLAATDENGKRLFDSTDQEQLPYRIPNTRWSRVIVNILEAMRNDFDEFLEEEKENFAAADGPVSATG